MGGICDECKRTTCEYRADDIAVCGLPKTETNWERLFGTPERAAKTLAKSCDECSEAFPCSECPLYPIVGNNVYEPEILEWLRSEER